MLIIGEIVAGSGTTFTLAHTPVANSQAIYAGTRLIEGSDQDYTISGAVITIVNGGSYPAGSIVADYATSSSNLVQSGNDILSPLALTTLQRVKDILFDPGKTVDLTGCSLTSSSVDVTGVTVPNGKAIQVGQTVSGTGVPAGTTIAAIISATEIHLSQAATATNTGQTLTVLDQPVNYDGLLIRYINWATHWINNECNRVFVQQTYVDDTYSITKPSQSVLKLRQWPVFILSRLQWRAGTPTNPNWTDFIADQYELIDPTTDPITGDVYYPKGLVRVYGVLPRIYNNMVRATYTAGYPVNWSDAEDGDNHMLPGDITNVCENMVVRRFKRRLFAGKTSESIEGATTTWSRDLDTEDREVLAQYKDLYF